MKKPHAKHSKAHFLWKSMGCLSVTSHLSKPMTRQWRRDVKVALQTAPIKEIRRSITLSPSTRWMAGVVRAFLRSATKAAWLGLVRVGAGSACKRRLLRAIALDSTSLHRGYPLTGRAETQPSLA
ncbi:MAG: hypothetical protein LC098_05750 [Burkholderiales bacterium]|nr:hypothetical protein [Burkholderiales bacterium]